MSFYLQDTSQPQPQSLAARKNLIMIDANQLNVLQGDVQIR